MINIKNTLDYIVNKTDNIIIVYYILSTMKAEEVLNLLQISRKTLHVYARDGRIQYTVMPNRMYNYNEEDVKRKTVIYVRVSTGRQKNDLQNRIEQMKQ